MRRDSVITIYKATTSLTDRVSILELRGKSTDTKPTDTICGYKVGNGSTFLKLTQARFSFSTATPYPG